jgi:S1-C subfamily serine protease
VGAAGALTTTPSDSVTITAFKKASPSVVYVDNVGIGSGSGVIYDSSGDIVTNAHVVSGEQSLKVTLSNGKSYTAALRGVDVADDLAVIHIKATGLPAAHFAGQGDFQVAQEVLAIGSPLGLQQTVTSGLISALGRTVQESTGAYLPDAVQTSAPINPGNSGGALVALDGSVVGIPTLEATDPQNNNGGAAQGIGFAVPSYRVTVIAHQIIADGKVVHTGRAYLGVGATDSGSAGNGNGSPFGFGSPTPSIPGALVNNVAQGSPAAAAGIQQGDVITALNGQPVTSESDLLVALAHAKPGQTVSITVNRNGQTLTLHAKLGELPAS